MKTKYFWGLLLSLLCVVSCDGLLEGFGGSGNTALQPDDQKVKLENVAIKLLDECPADDMERYLNLSEDFADKYLADGDYDFSAFETWADGFEDLTVEETKYVEKYDQAKDMYIRERVLNFTILLSNYTGSFEFKNDKVQKLAESTSGVKVMFPLNGKEYVAEILPSAKSTKATFEYMDKCYWTESEWTEVWNGEYYDYNVTYKDKYEDFRAKFAINIPENIKVKLTEDGKSVADVNIDITQSYSAAGLNPTTDNFNAKITVAFDNGYGLNIDNVAYDGAASKASYGFTLTKNGKALISSSASSDLLFALTTREYDHSYGDYVNKGEYTWAEVKRVKNVDVNVDILGEVQIKGTCTNVMEVSDYIDAFYRAAEDEDKTKMDRVVNNLNSKINLNVYYDKGSAVQASVQFEYEKHTDRYDSSYYYYEIVPVIVFGDNSRYAFEDYFTEASFGNLLDKLEFVGEDYEDLFGTAFDDFFVKEDMPNYPDQEVIIKPDTDLGTK